MKYFHPFLTNIPADYQQNLTSLSWFDVAEIQGELFVTVTNTMGEPYTPDLSPPAVWLAEDCDVVGYVNPWWLDTRYRPTNTPKSSDQYWIRRNLIVPLSDDDLVKDAGGTPIIYRNFDQSRVPDVTQAHVARHIVSTLLQCPAKSLVIDNGMLRRGSYYNAVPSITENEWNRAAFAVYDELRANQRKIIVNGAWEMREPLSNAWVYDAVDHVDGVLLEIPAGFMLARWWYLDDEKLRRVIQDWRNNDKEVWIFARYDMKAYNDARRLDEFARHYHDIARDAGATHYGVGDYGWSAKPIWFEFYERETLPPDDDVLTAIEEQLEIIMDNQVDFDKRVQEIERRLGKVAGAWNS